METKPYCIMGQKVNKFIILRNKIRLYIFVFVGKAIDQILNYGFTEQTYRSGTWGM